jgi:hypothetical protein
VSAGRFDDLDAPIRRWLEYEQTVNERLTNDAVHHPIDRRSNTVRAAYHPEQRRAWRQEVVWLPADQVRTYGRVTDHVRDAFGAESPDDRVPLLLHPQTPPAHRRLTVQYGKHDLAEVWATPTASYRSVLAWRTGKTPVLAKLSIGAIIGRTQRRLRENQVARAVLMSTIFDTIPSSHTARLRFDWFSEPAGMVETLSRHGWLLRRFPPTMTAGQDRVLVPMFSLISRRGGDPPLLVDSIRRSGQRPEAFVIDALITPYVEAVAYLLFVQGIQIEAHSQNTLVEIDDAADLTRRLAFRDLSDTSISIPLRLARRKPLPRPPPGWLPAGAPFPLASVVTDVACNFDRSTLFRAFDTVERYGLWGFLWSVNTSLQREFPDYRAQETETAYLTLWQQAAVRYLGVRPLFTTGPKGLATDESLAYFLRHVDWTGLGSVGGQSLPAAAEPLRIGGLQRRRAGPVYDRVECAWGDVFLIGGLPAFFRPAF